MQCYGVRPSPRATPVLSPRSTPEPSRHHRREVSASFRPRISSMMIPSAALFFVVPPAAGTQTESGRLGSMPRSRVLGSSCGYSACSQSSNNSGELASPLRIHFFSSLPFLGFSGSAPSANEACGFASIFRLKVSGNSRHLLFQKIVRTAPHRTANGSFKVGPRKRGLPVTNPVRYSWSGDAKRN